MLFLVLGLREQGTYLLGLDKGVVFMGQGSFQMLQA